MKERFDLVFVSMESWDDVWRRNQFVCAGLARRNPGIRIIFIGVQRNLWRNLLQRKFATLVKNPTWNVPGITNITVTSALRIGPERYTWGRRINEWITKRRIKTEISRVGTKKFLLWLNPHHAVHLVGQIGELAVIYDITDDWTKFGEDKVQTNLVIKQDLELCHLADSVIVCSKALYDAKRKVVKRLYLIPNGVDVEHYAGVTSKRLALVEPGREWNKPVLGYTGTLHSSRIDSQLIASVAHSFPEGSIVLVGPQMLDVKDRETLSCIPNVIFTGPVPYYEIPNYMRAFDVSITPHRVTLFTESLNPIKLWEYLAAGKPIVSTNIAGFRDYPELVRIADTHEQFADACRAALTEGDQLTERRKLEASKNSWSSRVDAIEDVIAACLQAKGVI